MNSYQRVMGTLMGQPVDRPPVLAVLGAYGGKLTGVDLRTLFSEAAAYVAGQRAVQKEFGFDLVMTPFVYTAIAEAFGGETAWSDRQPPNMKRPGVRSAAAVLSVPLPDPQKSPSLSIVLDATRRLADLYKEQVPILAVLPGPAIMPSLVIGMEQWMETVLFDEELSRKLLDYTAAFFVSWANSLLAAGADCLVVTEGTAAAEIAPRTLFAERFLPLLTSTFPRINGPKVLHHTAKKGTEKGDGFIFHPFSVSGSPVSSGGLSLSHPFPRKHHPHHVLFSLSQSFSVAAVTGLSVSQAWSLRLWMSARSLARSCSWVRISSRALEM